MGNKHWTIEEMQEIAQSRGGKCLSKEYVNARTKLKWQCEKGHTWRSPPRCVQQQGTWCRKCVMIARSQSKGLTIEAMQEIAKSRGGKCLSKDYVNANTKLKWQCSEGHTWEATPNSVKDAGTWCRKCARRQAGLKQKLKIEEMQEIAESHGGKCLTEEYVNSHGKLKWQCSEGHIWEANVAGMKNRKKWCPICGRKKSIRNRTGRTARLTISEMQQIAESRGGKCLSTKYLGTGIKLKWQCSEGHIWEAPPRRVKNVGSWCPICSAGKGERVVESILSGIFGQRFLKKRPKWLQSPEGGRLELDGFCKKLGIAFEYQGVQHYKVIKAFSTSECLLKRQQEVDKIKREICADRGITLLDIPYFIADPFLIKGTKKTFDRLQKYIIKQLVKQLAEKKVAIPKFQTDLYSRARKAMHSPQLLQEMRDIAKSEGGKCLSTEYISAHVQIEWRCKEGHTWKATPSSVKHGGSWCPTCAGTEKLSIGEAQEIALNRGGKCLSTVYVNAQSKLKWQCSKGHIWEAALYNLKIRKSWCPKCAIRRLGLSRRKWTIKDMQKLAQSQGGQCLSKQYRTVNKKLKGQCSEGHTWEATPNSVKDRGTWCRKCAFKQAALKPRLTIEEMQEIAQSRGGKCLSKEYVNAHTKLKWQCSEGHIWMSTPGGVKGGNWCRKCAYKQLGLKQRLSIEMMQEIAKSRGGKCLSKEYVNVHTKLKWQGSEGHTWEATPNHVKYSGSWCPVCGMKAWRNSRLSPQ